MTSSDVHSRVEAVWKAESARIIGALIRLVGDLGLAEDLAQDALVAALRQWPGEGVPDNPGAWLTAIAKRRAVDHIRRAQRAARATEKIAQEVAGGTCDDAADDHSDVLRLMFMSCHPVLPLEARVALTLRVVGGLSPAEIARAYLVDETRINRRLTEAKRTLAGKQVPFELPQGADLTKRLTSVLEVLYLIFNEGYSATAGDDLLRPELCMEALRLGRQLAELVPEEAEAHGLVALLELQASRAAVRTGSSGEAVPLHEQDRGRWDRLLIHQGFTDLLRARRLGRAPGAYTLQAAIAACHAQAHTAQETDWPRIVALYDALIQVLPTPVVALNRAVAIGMARGPAAGLAEVDALRHDPALRDYHLLPSVRADLLARLRRGEEAQREFRRAASMTANNVERAFLLRRADEIIVDPPASPTIGETVLGFLAREDLSVATRRSYAQTLQRLRRTTGDGLPLHGLTAEYVARAFAIAWHDASAATWNRHRAAIRSFGAWAGSEDLAAHLPPRPRDPIALERIDPDQLQTLCTAAHLPLRERTLWRLLHESAAPVRVVLALNVEDLDLDDRQARVGNRWVTWRSATARLLPSLIAGRTRGPLFLTDRRPGPARSVAAADLCPETGRSRLSYERAEYLFKRATIPLDPAKRGYTLGQLKPRSTTSASPGHPRP